MSPQDTQDLMPKNPALEDVFRKVNLGMYQIFHLKNLNLMTDWEYTRVNERQFFPQQISSIQSKIYNVDDNGRDAIQPSFFNTYCDMVNTQQLSRYNKMSQTLSKSPSSNNYKSIYGGLRRYSGNETRYTFEGDSNLKKHQGPESLNRDSKINKCRNTFDQMSGFSVDKSTCTGDRTYSEYGKVSNHCSELTQQDTVQNPQKENKCKVCEKVFSKSSNLSRHRRIHTGRKPFKCTECSRAFNCHSLLTQHQRIHAGKKPYICKECNKAFHHCSVLSRHHRIHTGEKPYKCKE